MAGIRAGGIKYAIGVQSAIGTRGAIEEGLPLLEHTTPLPITDSLKSANTTRPDYGFEEEYHITGTVYYTARVRIPFSPAWACRLLDLYFENTVPGAASNYDRQYNTQDIPPEPSEWLSLWKYTAKAGLDHNTVGVGGVIYGIAIEGAENQALTLSADIAFASREDAIATGTPSDWDINESSGDYTPIRNSDCTMIVGGAPRGIVSWNVSIQQEFRAHFYASQNPNRISRKGYRVEGQFVLRDKDAILETFESNFLSSTSGLLLISAGVNSITLATQKIHAPEIKEDKGTRYGTYNFTGLGDETTGMPPVRISLRPQIARL